MKELLDKLSAYNLFNYLLPGTIFVAIAQRISEHNFKQCDVIVELFASGDASLVECSQTFTTGC